MVLPPSASSDDPDLRSISHNLSELIKYIREKDDSIIKDKDDKIERLIKESTEWRIKYEMTVNRE